MTQLLTMLSAGLSILIGILGLSNGQTCSWNIAQPATTTKFIRSVGAPAFFTANVVGEVITNADRITWKLNTTDIAHLRYSSPSQVFTELLSDPIGNAASSPGQHNLTIDAVENSYNNSEIYVISGGCTVNDVSSKITLVVKFCDLDFFKPAATVGDISLCGYRCVRSFTCANPSVTFNATCDEAASWGDAEKEDLCAETNHHVTTTTDAGADTTTKGSIYLHSSQPCTTTGELKQVSDCGGEYYICDNGAWKIMPCPGGLKFSEAHNRCEWDYNVAGCSSTEDAETTTTTATTTTTTTTEADSSSSCTTIGELKQDSDCGGDYYICDHGGWTKMSCPAGLKFSEAANQCDWDYNVAGCNTDAAETTTTTAATTTTTEADSSASCTTSGELKQVSDCGGDYYICDHGKWTQMSCPAGLKFSEAANQCDWDYNVAGCNTDTAETTTTTTATTTTTTEADSSVSCTTSGELKQVSDCGGDYYICDHGKWTQMSCPAGLKFSEAANQCEWDYNVAGCNTDPAETTTTTVATTTTTTTTEDPDACTHEALIPTDECSGQFIQCVHGEEVIIECPADLIFDVETGRCEYEQDVASCAALAQVKEETVCEHDWLRIKCDDSKKIKVVSASFGRSSKDVCRYGLLKDTNCHSSKSDSVVSKKCEGKSRCNVWASIWLFGDPCFLTYKYLQVEYQCV